MFSSERLFDVEALPGPGGFLVFLFLFWWVWWLSYSVELVLMATCCGGFDSGGFFVVDGSVDTLPLVALFM
jgi:hypothetical protein